MRHELIPTRFYGKMNQNWSLVRRPRTRCSFDLDPDMLLEIKSAGDPVLRQTTRQLSHAEILSGETQQLIEYMRETMHKAPGVGLAAPQIGIALQIAVIEDKAEYLKDLPAATLAERERKPVPFHVVINPVLTLDSSVEVDFFEGCLSLPGLTALVTRARRVKVAFLNHLAQPVTVEASGWYARILQHEIDHLSGGLYIDRMDPRTLSTLDNYAKHWKDLPVAEVRRQLTKGR